jgi:hypothetical protein
VSKGERNRQQAREKIAQMRALEANRKRRRNWLISLGAVVIVAAAAVGITLAATGGKGTPGGSTPKLKLAALSTLGPLKAPPPPGSLGAEGVPVPQGPPLAGLASAATGQTVAGISCNTNEQLIFHIHAHLTIFVNGSPRQVPASIGIPGGQVQNSPQGPLIASGTCFYWLHTHANDGIVHIESPIHRTFTLGNFFDEWGQPLGPNQVGQATGPVTALYNGERYVGNPRNIPLNRHAQIQLEVGKPLIAPVTIRFPSGL